MKSTDSVIVSWDFSHGKDVGVLIVGKQEKGKVEIINAYQGEEARYSDHLCTHWQISFWYQSQSFR